MTTEKTLSGHKIEEPSITAINNLAVAVKSERSLKLEKRLEVLRSTLPYQSAYFRETFSDELWQAMEHRGFNQAQFAERASVTKQFLTKVFKGGNCTSDTIVKLAFALNYRAHIHLTPNDIGCEWFHRIEWNIPRQMAQYVGFGSGSSYVNVSQIEREVEYAVVPPAS